MSDGGGQSAKSEREFEREFFQNEKVLKKQKQPAVSHRHVLSKKQARPAVKITRPTWTESTSACQSGCLAQKAVRSTAPHLLILSQTCLLKLNFSLVCFFLYLPFFPPSSFALLSAENTQSTYRVSPDGSLRVTFTSGMEISLSSEPHILAGAVNPTLGKCNISLPGEHNANLIEWRQRKEQNKGNVSAFERRLRVSLDLIEAKELLFYFRKLQSFPKSEVPFSKAFRGD